MARHTFGGGSADVVIAEDATTKVVSAIAGLAVTLWDSRSGGTQITDLQNASLSPISFVISDSEGRLPPFFGPNSGLSALWADGGGLSRVLIQATDIPARVTAIELIPQNQNPAGASFTVATPTAGGGQVAVYAVLSANLTINAPPAVLNGLLLFTITADPTTAYTVTWVGFSFDSSVAPVMSTAGTRSDFVAKCGDGANWDLRLTGSAFV